MYLYGKDVASQGLVVDLALCPEVRRVRIRSLAELCPLVELLEDWMRLQGYPRRDIFAVTLALVEVTTNAVRHGNRGDARKHVRITYLMSPDEILIEVEDQGEGFDPAGVADPLAGDNVGRPRRSSSSGSPTRSARSCFASAPSESSLPTTRPEFTTPLRVVIVRR